MDPTKFRAVDEITIWQKVTVADELAAVRVGHARLAPRYSGVKHVTEINAAVRETLMAPLHPNRLALLRPRCPLIGPDFSPCGIVFDPHDGPHVQRYDAVLQIYTGPVLVASLGSLVCRRTGFSRYCRALRA